MSEEKNHPEHKYSVTFVTKVGTTRAVEKWQRIEGERERERKVKEQNERRVRGRRDRGAGAMGEREKGKKRSQRDGFCLRDRYLC